jgi:hypothetical protein
MITVRPKMIAFPSTVKCNRPIASAIRSVETSIVTPSMAGWCHQ